MIEKYGTSIKRIIKGPLNYGLIVPMFDQIGEMFRMTAYTKVGLPA